MADKTKSEQENPPKRAKVTVTADGRRSKNARELITLARKRGDLDYTVRSVVFHLSR